MVFGLIGLAAAIPSIVGLNEATKGTQDYEEQRREANRKARVHLIATCELTAASARDRQQIHNAKIVLRDGWLWLEKDPVKSHEFTGYYREHPQFSPGNMSGLVSTVSLDPPLLRWIFVDAKTFEVRYGGKADSEGHILGPWSWTKDENNVVLEDWEGFLAIWNPREEAWQLFFDQNDNGCGLPKGTRGVEISLRRITADH